MGEVTALIQLPHSFDVRGFGRELDKNSRPARFTVAFVPILMVGLSLFFIAFLFPKIQAGDLDAGGWSGLVIVLGFTAFILAQSRHSFWGSRRAATSVVVREDGIELVYPEGNMVRFAWTDSRPLFELDDVTGAPPYRKVLSTPYFLGERQRLSALSPEAYQMILNEARTRGVVEPVKPKRSWFYPGLAIPTAWAVAGKGNAPSGVIE